MLLEAQKSAEWADSRSDCTKVSSRHFGHSLYRLLGFRVFLRPVSPFLLVRSSGAVGAAILFGRFWFVGWMCDMAMCMDACGGHCIRVLLL